MHKSMGIADLKSQLKYDDALNTLVTAIAGPASSLDGASSPATGEQLATATAHSSKVDLSTLTAATEQIAQQLPALLKGLPSAQDAIGPLTSALELVETVSADDLGTQIQHLTEKLSAELGSSRDGGFLAAFERMAGLLSGSPETKALLQLLQTIFHTGGVGFQPSEVIKDAVPALTHTINAFGALMTLESTLADGERLTTIMAHQLDPGQIALETAVLRNCFRDAAAAVEHFRSAGASATDRDAEAVTAALRACNARLAGFDSVLSQAMGFGEATLVHFNMPQLQSDVQEGTTTLRAVDVDVIARALQALLDRIKPVLTLDLQAAPAQSLDALLHLLEDKVADIASAVSSVDLGPAIDPLKGGIAQITGVVGSLADVFAQITSTIRAALEQVRQVLSRLPTDEIASAVQTVLAPIVQAMDFIRGLIADVEAALKTVVDTVTKVLAEIEHAIDTFKAEIDKILSGAADLIETLNIDGVLGQVADKVKDFANILAKAQMRPYFDKTVEVIGTAADVIGALPLGLLPDSMKADLDAAVAPIRAIDVEQVKDEIEGLLQIEDGTFALGTVLRNAVAEIQAKYDELIGQIEEADPRNLIPPINKALTTVKDKLTTLVPQLSLQPVTEALDKLKGSLAAFDLDAQLKPVDDAFAKAVAVVDDYSPAKLIEPLEQRVKAARDKVVSFAQLEQWAPTLDALAAEAKALLDSLDPAQVQPAIETAFAEVTRLLAQADQLPVASGFGDLIAVLLSGSGRRVHPWTFDVVVGWLTGTSGRTALGGHAEQIAANIEATRSAVRSVDVAAFTAEVGQQVAALRAFGDTLTGDSPPRAAMRTAIARLNPEAPLAALATNQARYLSVLDAAEIDADALRRTGLSEVDVTVVALQTASSPLALVTKLVRSILGQIGITGFDGGIAGVVRRVFEVATPERLSHICTPVFKAARDRVSGILDMVVTPLKDGIAKLTALVNAIELTSLREGIERIVGEMRDQILALSPRRLLGSALSAFEALKAEVVAFDPLQTVRDLIEGLKGAATRVLDKLSGQALLAQVIRIYDDIMKALRSLNLSNLLAPVLDQLDDLAAQVDDGLGRTAQAIEQLQAALPGPDSGGAVSGSASLALT